MDDFVSRRMSILDHLAERPSTTEEVAIFRSCGRKTAHELLLVLEDEGYLGRAEERVRAPSGKLVVVWVRTSKPFLPPEEGQGYWTDERIDTLTTMVTTGSSAGQVAAILGCTRNAVIGKAGRMKLPLGGGKASRPARLKRLPQAPRPAKQPAKQRAPKGPVALGIVDAPVMRVVPVPKPRIVEPDEDSRSLLDLGRFSCHFPVGDWEVSQMFCGKRIDGISSYCPRCHPRTVQPGSVSKANRSDRHAIYHAQRAA